MDISNVRDKSKRGSSPASQKVWDSVDDVDLSQYMKNGKYVPLGENKERYNRQSPFYSEPVPNSIESTKQIDAKKEKEKENLRIDKGRIERNQRNPLDESIDLSSLTPDKISRLTSSR